MQIKDFLPHLPHLEPHLFLRFHIPTLAYCYAFWILVLALAGSWVCRHGFVIQMFTYVNDYIVIALAVAVPVVWAMIMGYSRFISNQKDIKVAQKEAKLNNGGVVDTVNAELGAKYWYGYLILGIFGAVICAFLGLYVTDVLAGHLYISGEEEIALCAVGIAVILEMIADAKVINNLGDVAFFVSKEEDAIDEFLAPAQDAVEASNEPKTQAEQLAELLTAVLAKKN